MRSWEYDLAFLATQDQIQEIRISVARRKKALVESELQDSELRLQQFLTQETGDPGPLICPPSPKMIETPDSELDLWDDLTDSGEAERLRLIYVNPSMTEFKGTSEGAIIAKWHTLTAHTNM